MVLGETITVIHPGPVLGRDRHGNTVRGPEVEVAVAGCAIAPKESNEPVEAGRAAVASTVTIYTPPGAVIGPSDRLRLRETIYQVQGEPAGWTSPFTGHGVGLVVTAARIAG